MDVAAVVALAANGLGCSSYTLIVQAPRVVDIAEATAISRYKAALRRTEQADSKTMK